LLPEPEVEEVPAAAEPEPAPEVEVFVAADPEVEPAVEGLVAAEPEVEEVAAGEPDEPVLAPAQEASTSVPE